MFGFPPPKSLYVMYIDRRPEQVRSEDQTNDESGHHDKRTKCQDTGLAGTPAKANQTHDGSGPTAANQCRGHTE